MFYNTVYSIPECHFSIPTVTGGSLIYAVQPLSLPHKRKCIYSCIYQQNVNVQKVYIRIQKFIQKESKKSYKIVWNKYQKSQKKKECITYQNFYTSWRKTMNKLNTHTQTTCFFNILSIDMYFVFRVNAAYAYCVFFACTYVREFTCAGNIIPHIFLFFFSCVLIVLCVCVCVTTFLKFIIT